MTIKPKNNTPFNDDGDSFPLLPKANAVAWNEKAGLCGTRPSYTMPALDTTGFPDDSVTGDFDCGF